VLANYIDTTPPSTQLWVNDGFSLDTDVTGSTTELSANWDASIDMESGVSYYWYSIGESAGASDVVAWATVGAETITVTGLSLTHNQDYYFTVQAENGVGLISTGTVISDGQTVDATPPDMVTYVNDGTGADADYTIVTGKHCIIPVRRDCTDVRVVDSVRCRNCCCWILVRDWNECTGNRCC